MHCTIDNALHHKQCTVPLNLWMYYLLLPLGCSILVVMFFHIAYRFGSNIDDVTAAFRGEEAWKASRSSSLWWLMNVLEASFNRHMVNGDSIQGRGSLKSLKKLKPVMNVLEVFFSRHMVAGGSGSECTLSSEQGSQICNGFYTMVCLVNTVFICLVLFWGGIIQLFSKATWKCKIMRKCALENG